MSKSVQYDLSAEEYRKIQDRARIRAQMRKEFLKLYQNPYRMASEEIGYGFDPQIQRYISMKATRWQFFKPNTKTVIVPIVLFGTILSLGYMMQKEWEGRERLIRTGQVSPRDRRWRFV